MNQWLVAGIGILFMLLTVPAFIWDKRRRDRKFKEAVKAGDHAAMGSDTRTVVGEAPLFCVAMGSAFLLAFTKLYFSH